MSESRDRSMRRSRGTSRNVIDGKVKLERAQAAGQHEQVVFPSVESVKEAVLAGICPCCGKGPFALLARHTNARHGIDKKELRDLAGLAYKDSITAGELKERRRQIAVELITAGRLRSPGGVPGRTPLRSKAGKERMKRKPSTEAPPCANCGRPARRKDTSAWQEENRSGAWLKSCSDECGQVLRRAAYDARTKPRPSCVVCGTTISNGRGRPGKVKTCSVECDRARRAKTMRETRRRMLQGDSAGPVRPDEEPTT